MKESGIAVPAKPNHYWRVIMTPSPKYDTPRLCACGCQRFLPPSRYNSRFINGHNNARWLGVAPFVIENRGYKTPCWVWQKCIDHQGYAMTKGRQVHRSFYQLLVGKVPAGLQLDHLCRVRNCVNPQHLEPVTNRENTIRGLAAEVNRARMLARTQCVNGHEYTPENTFFRKTGTRECRTCMREQCKRHRAAQRIEAGKGNDAN